MVNDRINKLRELMKLNNIDAYLVDDADNHSSEYVNVYYKDRSFMSSFLGSNGKLLVLIDSAYLWTDGRYFLQAEMDLKDTCITLMKMGEKDIPTLDDFINDNLKNKTLGLNGDRFSYSFVSNLDKSIKIESNLDLVKEINKDAKLEFNEILSLPIEITGESVDSKLAKVRKELDSNSLFLTRLDDIAYLYNLRGKDILMSLLFLSFTYITKDKAYIFLDKNSLTKDAYDSLINNNVIIKEYNEIKNFLNEVKNETICLPFKSTNYSFINILSKNNTLIDQESPTLLMKAIKNETEIKNNIEIHKLDGLAIFRFQKFVKEYYKKVDMDEWSLASLAEAYRRLSPKYLCPSFDCISGFKENGAIIHYEPNEFKFKKIDSDSFILLDSGGQYYGGTTDITRTYSLGSVSDEQKLVYTLVLKGHLGIIMARINKDSKGKELDTIARKALNDYGYDYNHGTGHGVGYMMNVHEGPNAFRRDERGESIIYPNMITSDEPGCYLEGKFGVRIESEVLSYIDNDKLCFKPITFAPIDLDPIDVKLLTKEEKASLNDYHKLVYNNLKDLVEADELEYLKEVTREI